MELTFFKGKKILITGNTGFKGTWLSLWLQKLGAEIIGYSLPAPTSPSFYDLVKDQLNFITITGDINNLSDLKRYISCNSFDLVFHLAAQPIVSESYKNPTYTLQTNIMGTANLLEACRGSESIKSIVIVTSDKCYRNNEWEFAYRENDTLGGLDPYSCSKSCSELIADSYRKSFNMPISTVRAGNVIGGGDFALNRIIPDIIRSVESGKDLLIRNLDADRPFQHALDCLYGYLLVSEYTARSSVYCRAWNIAPEESYKVYEVIRFFSQNLSFYYKGASEVFPEARSLKLDSSRVKRLLKYNPLWSFNESLNQTLNWYKAYLNKEDLYKETIREIEFYESSIR